MNVFGASIVVVLSIFMTSPVVTADEQNETATIVSVSGAGGTLAN
jgi:hypothetical protein